MESIGVRNRDDDELSVTSVNSYVTSMAHTGINYLRPLTPYLTPILICVAAIPILITFSLAAGWTVYKSAPAGWTVPVYLQYGDDRPPYAFVPLPSLTTDQPYDISLLVRVPAIEANYALGNFMTTLTLSTMRNVTIMTVRRPTLVLPSSPRIPFLGHSQRILDLKIHMLSAFVPGLSGINAYIEMGRSDGWKSLGNGEGREISVYSALLHGEVRPQGFRYILSRFPVSTGAVASIIFFALSLLVLILCLAPTIRRRSQSDDGSVVNTTDPTDDGSKRAKRERRENQYERDSSPQSYPSPGPEKPLSALRQRSRRSSASSYSS